LTGPIVEFYKSLLVNADAFATELHWQNLYNRLRDHGQKGNMPGMDGLQLLVEIKQRSPDLPVMMVTAYDDDERPRQAAEYGAAEFLTKPVDFERLKAQLGQLPSAPD
jgi:DNA-binding NtrC family response regulator